MHQARRTGTRRLRCGAAVAMVLSTLAAIACHHATPTAPGPTRVAIEGTWQGTLTDRTGVESQMAMTITGIETSASGTFALSFDDASKNARGIVLASTIDVPTVHLTLNIQQAGPGCTGTPGVFYHARVALAGNVLDGDYEPAFGCDLLTRGAIRLTRR